MVVVRREGKTGLHARKLQHAVRLPRTLEYGFLTMICPHCGHDNLPGSEECTHCHMDLTQLDRPVASDRIERRLVEDPVSLLQPRKPITLKPTATIREAIKTMLERDVGALLVVDEAGKLLGIFSERDLLTRVAGLTNSYADLPVSQFMTAGPETVTSSDTMAFALHKMDVGGYRHLPVVDDDRPIGVISVRDMLRFITRLCKDN
jgi:CBS domain-containing protein